MSFRAPIAHQEIMKYKYVFPMREAKTESLNFESYKISLTENFAESHLKNRVKKGGSFPSVTK